MPTTMCTGCGAVLQLPDNWRGKQIKCMQCNNIFSTQAEDKKPSSPSPPPAPTSVLRSTTCTKCNTVLQVPAELVGKPVKCVKCNTVLDIPSATKSRVTTRPQSLPKNNIPTVVARRSGAPLQGGRRLGIGWMLLACAALMVPILAASAFTGWRMSGGWKSGGWKSVWTSSSSAVAYAGIEIGSNGPRYCVVEFNQDANSGVNFKVLAHGATTARLTAKMETTGDFDANELRKAISAVQTFHERVAKEHKLAPEQIVIVSSDTLFGPILKRGDIDQREKDRQIKHCREVLAAAVKKATDQTMEFANLTKYAEHELRAVVRKSDLKDAVFIDIGGGSTRGAYCDAADLIQAAEGPGITSFIGRVNDGLPEDGNFAERAAALSEQHLREPFRATLGKDPEFTARSKIYLAGGIAWVMANCQHPSETEDYVRLSAADIEQFNARVRQNPDLLNKIQPDPTLPLERQEWLKGEYARMRNAFKAPPGRLVAGAEILLALSTEFRFTGREVWFYRHSDFAWVASYIEETRRPRK